MSCVVCQQENTKDVCSECLQPFCGIVCFLCSQHALICAGGKRVNPEVTDQEVLQMFEADNVDGIRELLEDKRMPTNLISLRYAKSIEMATLLRDNEGDPFEYIGDGRIALDECMKYFDVRPLLPRSEDELVVDVVNKLRRVRDAHVNLCPSITMNITIIQTDEKRTFVGQLLTETLKLMKNDPEQFLKGVQKNPYLVELGKDVNLDELYKELLFRGFVPIYTEKFIIAVDDKDDDIDSDSFGVSEIEKYMEDRYLNRYDKKTLAFWYGVRMLQPIFQKWTFYNTDKVEQRAQQTPESFSSMINGLHDNVFKESRRAKTRMHMFRTVDSKTIATAAEAVDMIPVARYAEGMKGSLFYDDEDARKQSYCGTFYYYEPESTVFLKHGKILRVKDKREAAEKLGIHSVHRKWHRGLKESESDYLRRSEITREKILRIALSDEKTASLMFTPRELIDFFKNNNISLDGESENYARLRYIVNGPPKRLFNMQPNRKYYCGHVLRLYALQDFLDQPICTAAYKQGYDIVVLTHMVGSRQMVTEVLDVRSREESFANLHYLV